jgi:hypothetical protein
MKASIRNVASPINSCLTSNRGENQWDSRSVGRHSGSYDSRSVVTLKRRPAGSSGVCGNSRYSLTVRGGPAATLKILGDCSPSRGRETKPFAHLRPSHIILIRGQRNRRQNANDRHDDHQFDQRKALLGPVVLFHLQFSLVGVMCMCKRVSPSAKYEASPVPTPKPAISPPFRPFPRPQRHPPSLPLTKKVSSAPPLGNIARRCHLRTDPSEPAPHHRHPALPHRFPRRRRPLAPDLADQWPRRSLGRADVLDSDPIRWRSCSRVCWGTGRRGGPCAGGWR